MLGRTNLIWKDDKLLRGKTVVGKIIRDTKYLEMWRVELKTGTLTGMVNRTRAKDAAETIALGELNA